MRYLLVLLGLMLANTAQASIDCSKQPDCASLGFVKTDDDACATDGYVYCPFDHTYKKCVERDCAKLGFTETDKSSWCADIIKCKTNEKLTLCETPCLAWDQATLKSLAGSGKCKVVTVKNDITVDAKTLINVAQGTTIEGNGHTLTMLKGNADIIRLQPGTGLRNLTINRTINSASDLQLFATANNAIPVLEDVTVIENNENSEFSSFHKITYGSFTFRGKCQFLVMSGKNYSIMSGSKKGIFENATVDMASTYDVFVNAKDLTLTNSVINVTKGTFLFNGKDLNLTLTNSTLKAKVNNLTYLTNHTITLNEGSRFEAEVNDLGAFTCTLNGTEDKPVTLVSNKTSASAVVDVKNLNATVTLKGVTYKPKKIGTFTTTEITTSTDWEKVSQ